MNCLYFFWNIELSRRDHWQTFTQNHCIYVYLWSWYLLHYYACIYSYLVYTKLFLILLLK